MKNNPLQSRDNNISAFKRNRIRKCFLYMFFKDRQACCPIFLHILTNITAGDIF
ncbi:hypothetical protein DCCM_2258 [Desulfocucumis palustris]|uniref:Uncharacterized protein n=1 Tax=Desulfocucumis palustris TaxID=1898651 RepID=A0A2L2XH02_9FIRM|nr:hypothetical protein DCCM_2258 [Desulfocucumis palustris]